MQPTRRRVLKAGVRALSAAPLLVVHRADAAADTSFSGDIDAHCHAWSGDLERYPIGSWATRAEMRPATFTAEQLLAVTRPAGVDRVVLIQHAPLHGYDNSYILACARANPGVFSVVAMIDERLPRLGERLRDLRDQGARGIRISPIKHADRTPVAEPPRWLESPGMVELWGRAADLRVAVCPLVTAEFLPTLDVMCAKHSDTTCVIDHFGHIDTDKPETVAALTRLARHRCVLVKVSAFYKFADRKAPYDDLAPMMRKVIDAFGPDRLMWASDCPYQLEAGNTYADAIALIRQGLDGLSGSDRRAILRDTAARVFF